MSKIKAVIFDWAGTTIDYGSFAPVGAFIDTFQNKGITPTIEEVREPMGMLKKEHIRYMLESERISKCWLNIYEKNYTHQDLDEMYDYYETGLLRVLHKYVTLKPYLLETVLGLRKLGIKIGSTTGYNNKMMEIILPLSKSNGYSPDFWCSPDLVAGKSRPYPFMIFENMKNLEIMSTESVIKVGDTISDIHEGKNAGVYSVGIVEGSSEMGLSYEEYESLSESMKSKKIQQVTKKYLDAGADKVILNLSEIMDLVI